MFVIRVGKLGVEGRRPWCSVSSVPASNNTVHFVSSCFDGGVSLFTALSWRANRFELIVNFIHLDQFPISRHRLPPPLFRFYIWMAPSFLARHMLIMPGPCIMCSHTFSFSDAINYAEKATDGEEETREHCCGV